MRTCREEKNGRCRREGRRGGGEEGRRGGGEEGRRGGGENRMHTLGQMGLVNQLIYRKQLSEENCQANEVVVYTKGPFTRTSNPHSNPDWLYYITRQLKCY